MSALAHFADSSRTSREVREVPISLFADTAELVLAPARVLLRHKADPGRKIPPRSEGLWISDAGDQSGGERGTDAGNLIQPLARLTGSVPGHDQAIELQYLGLEHPQLRAKSGNARTCDVG